jgi:hypothetical protein
MRSFKPLHLTFFLSLALFLFSCDHPRPNPQERFNDKTPGRKVISSYQNNNPQVVFFYEVNKDKKITDKKVGEMYYRDDKSVYIGGAIKNEKRDGAWKAFHPNGKVQTDAYYIDGKEDGEYTVYYDNGQKRYSGHYSKGICDGEWKFYTKGGTLSKTLEAEGNTIVCGSCARCINIAKSKK